MNDSTDNGAGNVRRRLADAVQRVRTAETERSDVVVELRDAERARLEILSDELRGVFADVPTDDEQFIFDISAGLPPRLWIDVTTFVVMGNDRRTYRFLKDTRLGRSIIRETAEVGDMADTITAYVAERIVERERAVEGDWLARQIARSQRAAIEPPDKHADLQIEKTPASAPSRSVPPQMGWLVATFLAGALVGVVALFGTAWIAAG